MPPIFRSSLWWKSMGRTETPEPRLYWGVCTRNYEDARRGVDLIEGKLSDDEIELARREAIRFYEE